MPSSSLASLPSPTDLFASIYDAANPTFQQFLPWALYGLGLMVGAIIAVLVVNMIKAGGHKLTQAVTRTPHYMTERDQVRYHENLETGFLLSADDPAARAQIVAMMDEEDKLL